MPLLTKWRPFLLRFRSVREEDLDSLLVEAVPEKTKVATKYSMNIFHGKNRSRKMTLMNLLLCALVNYHAIEIWSSQSNCLEKKFIL